MIGPCESLGIQLNLAIPQKQEVSAAEATFFRRRCARATELPDQLPH
jgi:hypothetical protein